MVSDFVQEKLGFLIGEEFFVRVLIFGIFGCQILIDHNFFYRVIRNETFPDSRSQERGT